MPHGEPQDLDSERHQKRADDMGDAMRRYLVGINTGGIGVVVALSSGDYPALGSWGLFVPFGFFVLGIITTGGSLALQKHKTLKRRDAAQKSESMPNYDCLLFRNQTHDILAGTLFIIGAVVGMFFLLCG